MEECVHALIGGKLGRYAHHQVGIDNRDCRKHRDVEYARLLFEFIVRDDGEHIYLRAGSGTGRNGNNRCARMSERLVSAFCGKRIIPQVAIVDHHQRDTLTGIHHRTATECHYEIASVFTGFARSVHDVVACGVGTDFIEKNVFYACLIEFLFNGCQIAVFLRALSVGSYDKCLLAGHLFQMKILQLSCPEKHFRRHIKLKIVHGFMNLTDLKIYFIRVEAGATEILHTVDSQHIDRG
jgi:hypothetical protein